MTKQDLASKLALKIDLSKKESEKITNAFFESLIEGLAEDREVKIVGFGNFTARVRKAREGRNPKSGEKISIPESKVITFKAGKTFKDAVNGEDGK